MIKVRSSCSKTSQVSINQGGSVDLHSGLSIETLAYEVLLPTEDRLEALQASVKNVSRI